MTSHHINVVLNQIEIALGIVILYACVESATNINKR